MRSTIGYEHWRFSSRRTDIEFTNLKYGFGNRHFWAKRYKVSTVGLNEASVKKYIREQENVDWIIGKVRVKELEDPFRGGELQCEEKCRHF